MSGLGTEAGETSVSCSSRMSAGCMWWRGEQRIDSVGMIRLAIGRRRSARRRCRPWCTIMLDPAADEGDAVEARARRTPLITVLSRVPPAIESVVSTTPSSSISGSPRVDVRRRERRHHARDHEHATGEQARDTRRPAHVGRPLAEQDRPARDRLRGDGLDDAGRDLARGVSTGSSTAVITSRKLVA